MTNRRPRRVHVPGLVKKGVVAQLDNVRVQVNVADVVVGHRVAEEDAAEIMAINF